MAGHSKRGVILLQLCVVLMTSFFNQAHAQTLNAPEYVNANEDFTFSFELEGKEISDKASTTSLEIYSTPKIIIKNGPMISKSSSVSIMSGKTTATYTTTFTYVASAVESGPFRVDSIFFNRPQSVPSEIRQTESIHPSTTVSNDLPKENKSISSIGRRTDNINVQKYNSKSGIVTNITGWCYNVSTDKWSGNKGFIHSTKGAGSPSMVSPICYSLQVCEYLDTDRHYYILKWKGISSLNTSSYQYFVFGEEQYKAFCSLTAKGVLEEVAYTIPFDKPTNDSQEIKEVLEMHSLVPFAARLDEGNVVRFNFDEHRRNISKNREGIVDFAVESDKYTMKGYFEMPLADWKTLFRM